MAKKGGGEVKETALEREQASNAQAMRNDWVERWRPLEEKFIADVKDADPERRQAQGIAAVETTDAFKQARDGVEVANTATGARPGSSRFALDVTGTGTDEGTAMGLGQVEANTAVNDRQTAGLQSVVQLGRGQQVSALNGLDALANNSAANARQDARASLEASQAGRAAALQVAGAAAGGMSKAGTMSVPEAQADWSASTGITDAAPSAAEMQNLWKT